MQKWRGMHKGLSDAPKRSKYRVRKGWHRVLFENSAKHPTSSSGKASPKDGRTYRCSEDAEDSPCRIPFMRGGARHHYRTGWFRKFLFSQVGRPWDVIYSEIRQGLDYRNGAQWRALEQLLYWVETRCWVHADGEIYVHFANGAYPIWDNTFYVHPQTGMLEYSGSLPGGAQRRRKRKGAYEKEFYANRISDPCDKNNFLEKDEWNGAWYAVRRELYQTELGMMYRHKRLQLSKRELQQCELENEFMEFIGSVSLTYS